jgi:hypothetical protein
MIDVFNACWLLLLSYRHDGVGGRDHRSRCAGCLGSSRQVGMIDDLTIGGDCGACALRGLYESHTLTKANTAAVWQSDYGVHVWFLPKLPKRTGMTPSAVLGTYLCAFGTPIMLLQCACGGDITWGHFSGWHMQQVHFCDLLDHPQVMRLVRC